MPVCLLWHEQPTSGHPLSQRKVIPYPREINFQEFHKYGLGLGSPFSIHSEILSGFMLRRSYTGNHSFRKLYVSYRVRESKYSLPINALSIAQLWDERSHVGCQYRRQAFPLIIVTPRSILWFLGVAQPAHRKHNTESNAEARLLVFECSLVVPIRFSLSPFVLILFLFNASYFPF